MTTTDHLPATGRSWAYIGALLGGIVSVAANIAHSFIPPTGAPTTWHPAAGAVAASIVWPVFLFIAIEILARISWPNGIRWALARFGGIIPVAAIAAIVSYRHLSGLLAHYDEEPLVYHLGPLAVDGLMVMATAALLATAHQTATPSGIASAPTATMPAPQTPSASSPNQAGNAVSPPSAATPGRAIVPVRILDPIPAHLLGSARFAANHYENTTGQRITAPDLAVRLSIPTETATRLLRELHGDTTTPINGHPVEAVHP